MNVLVYLLAGWTLIAVSVWLNRTGKKTWFTLIRVGVMLITTIVSLTYFLFSRFLPSGNVLLAITDLILLALSIGVVVLSVRQFSSSPAPSKSALSA